MDLWQFLETRVERTPDRLLLSCGELRQPYAAFLQSALRAASALRALGVQEGDTVCLMLRNGPAYLYAWFGLARLGAVAVPINVHSKGEGLAYILRHSGARLLIAEADLLPRLAEAQDAPSLTTIAVGGEDTPAERSWSALLEGAGTDCPGRVSPPESVNAILYTSGTTGPPKGVMLSHQAYLNAARTFAEQMVGASADDVLYTSLPLFHINAQAHTVLPALYVNATMALGEQFSAHRF